MLFVGKKVFYRLFKDFINNVIVYFWMIKEE